MRLCKVFAKVLLGNPTQIARNRVKNHRIFVDAKVAAISNDCQGPQLLCNHISIFRRLKRFGGKVDTGSRLSAS